MDAIKRVDRICLALTVAIYAVATPFIELISHFPWIPQTLTKSLAAFIASVGSYSIIVNTLPALADGWKPLKKYFIGAAYVEGTWIGFTRGDGNSVNYIVEIFEQDITSVTVRGFAYDEDGRLTSSWNAPMANIDAKSGVMKYVFSSDLGGKVDGEQYGMASMQFMRKNSSSAPRELQGTFVNVIDGSKRSSTERRFADHPIELTTALTEARKFYREQAGKLSNSQ